MITKIKNLKRCPKFNQRMPEKITWKSEKREISKLKPFEGNPRKANEKEVNDLTKSLDRFNLADPLIINTTGEIIGGNFRFSLLKKKGIKDVDVRVPNRKLSRKEAEELNLRLNKNQGLWDFDILANLSEDLLKDSGFSSEELDKIFGTESVDEDDFDLEAELLKIKKPTTKRGQIISLGSHRLMCGDATKEEDVKKLMKGGLAQMVFTDPPYNVGYDYNTKYKFKNPRGKSYKTSTKMKSSLGTTAIFNDAQSPQEFYEFLKKAFINYYNHTRDDMAIYVCYSTSTYEQFANAFKDAKFHESQIIIWLKDRLVLALGQDYHRVYEPIIFGWKKGKIRYTNEMITNERNVWDLDKKKFEERLDVWYIKKDKAGTYEHPTQKPIRLAERAIKKNSRRGDIVLDFFGGSGSTLLGCEQLDRHCYMMELDPIYCDVIIKRYERFTGNKAENDKK
ncbi:MAG: DNA modification methylase [Candidatus Nealsonbacteria bacterium]